MSRTAAEIVRAYGVDAWTNGRDDLIPELCHDPIIRHDANREVRLSHAEQRARMRHNFEELRPVFKDVVLAGDDEYVTLVWNVTGRDPSWKWCGIEVFRVVDGRIAEVWNSPYMDGGWGLSKSLNANIDGEFQTLQLVRSDIAAEGNRASGTVIVPAEAAGLGFWLGQMFGNPKFEDTDGRQLCTFSPGGSSRDTVITVSDDDGSSIGLTNVIVSAITIEWERSGLINAAVTLAADLTVPSQGAIQAPFGPRLSETFGSFDRTDMRGRVVEGGLTLSFDGTARGRVSVRSEDSDGMVGTGRLALGWRNGNQSIIFAGTATLSSPDAPFEDAGETQASYEWEGAGFSAVITGWDS